MWKWPFLSFPNSHPPKIMGRNNKGQAQCKMWASKITSGLWRPYFVPCPTSKPFFFSREKLPFSQVSKTFSSKILGNPQYLINIIWFCCGSALLDWERVNDWIPEIFFSFRQKESGKDARMACLFCYVFWCWAAFQFDMSFLWQINKLLLTNFLVIPTVSVLLIPLWSRSVLAFQQQFKPIGQAVPEQTRMLH